MINIYKIVCRSSLLGETSFQLCFACITMTARFSFVEKSELFELITVLAPELPRGPCWNPCVTGGKRKKKNPQHQCCKTIPRYCAWS